MDDDAITQGGIGGLESPVYICEVGLSVSLKHMFYSYCGITKTVKITIVENHRIWPLRKQKTWHSKLSIQLPPEPQL